LALGIVLVIALIVVDSLTTSYVWDGLDTFLEWVEDNAVAGVFVFTVVYACATILFIPGSILTLGAGFVFSAAFGSLGAGLLVGSAVVFTGASAGALVSFLVGRYVGREWVTRVLVRKYNLVAALEGALQGRKGLRIMCLLRLAPIIPFNAINYIAGATPLSLMHYTMALLAIFPGTVLYVFLGASAGSLTDSMSSGSDPTVTIIVVVVGLPLVTWRLVSRPIMPRRNSARLSPPGRPNWRPIRPSIQTKKSGRLTKQLGSMPTRWLVGNSY
jgi:uncharacterized membrane protein YdjX (TVP38/TMEM64 family)